MRVLRNGGRLELRTDSDKYFWYALETFFAIPKVEVEVRKNAALEVTSKYEARWRRQEKDIYDVYVTCKEISEPKNEVIDFAFHDVKYIPGIEEKLIKKPVVLDGYFVHFERLYKTSDDALLIKCAFGSFDRPEHKYILLGKEGCRYFVAPPVKTKVNFDAHRKIAEYLTRGVGDV
jgi:tRNA (guanine-N7-)-methyltransferase